VIAPPWDRLYHIFPIWQRHRHDRWYVWPNGFTHTWIIKKRFTKRVCYWLMLGCGYCHG